MPQRHRAPDGTVHVFPDDFTDDEIAQAFESGNREAGAAHGAPGSTYLGDVGQMLKGEGIGAVKGAFQPVLHPIDTAKGIYDLGEDILTNRGQRTIQGVKRIYENQDPEQAGEVVGNILGGALLGKAIPTAIPKIPKAMVATGRGLEKIGSASRRISPFGVAEAVFRADPHGLAVAAAPYAIKGTGTLLRKAGEYLSPSETVAPSAARASTRATLSAGEEAGIKSLDDLMDALHGQDQPMRGNGLAPVAPSSDIPLTRNPRIGPPREGPTTWDAKSGPTMTTQDRALLDELLRGEPEPPWAQQLRNLRSGSASRAFGTPYQQVGR